MNSQNEYREPPDLIQMMAAVYGFTLAACRVAHRWYDRRARWCPCVQCRPPRKVQAAVAGQLGPPPSWAERGGPLPHHRVETVEVVQPQGTFVGIAAETVEAGAMVSVNLSGGIVPLRRVPSSFPPGTSWGWRGGGPYNERGEVVPIAGSFGLEEGT